MVSSKGHAPTLNVEIKGVLISRVPGWGGQALFHIDFFGKSEMGGSTFLISKIGGRTLKPVFLGKMDKNFLNDRIFKFSCFFGPPCMRLKLRIAEARRKFHHSYK